MKLFISIDLVLNIFVKVKEFIKKFPGNKNIKTNIFRVQGDNSIMCGYFCIGFIDFILAGKKLTDCTSYFLHMV